MKTPEASPEEKLFSLLELFDTDGALGAADLDIVEESELPAYYRQLLAHHFHMTVTLEAHHGHPVKLSVLEKVARGDDYARRLYLTSGADDQVVLTGIMRIRLELCSDDVRAAIVEGKTPLGRILIEHDVLRWIEPEAYLRVRIGESLRRLLRVGPDVTVTYGRMATIFCDNQPAVELIEIVAPGERP